MAHSQETKTKALEMLMQGHSIKHIENALGVAGRTVRNWRTQMEDEMETQEWNDSFKQPELFEDYDPMDGAEEEEITLELSTGERTFTRAEIDEFFLYYSNKGHDFSQRQMINHFGINNLDWGKMKNSFGLLKVSNIFSDFTFDNIPPSHRLQAVEDRLAEVHKNANVAIDRAYTKGLQKSLKKKLDAATRYEEVQKHFFASLAANFAEVGTVKVVRRVVEDANGPDNLLLALSDIHINSRVEGLRDAQDYNNDVCREYLAKSAIDANAKNAEKVTVLLNGDIIESITGKNHPDVFTEMENKSTYADGIMKAVNILAEFLGKVNNLDKVIIVSGNHDRLTSSNHEDAHGGAAQIISEFLKLMLYNTEVEWDPKVISHETKDCVFICSHGDKLQRVKPEEIFYRYGSRNKFNFYLTGHWHNRAIKSDTRFGRHISLPSIFTGNTYSDFAGFTSDPGFLMIYSENGKPVVEDRSL